MHTPLRSTGQQRDEGTSAIDAQSLVKLSTSNTDYQNKADKALKSRSPDSLARADLSCEAVTLQMILYQMELQQTRQEHTIGTKAFTRLWVIEIGCTTG